MIFHHSSCMMKLDVEGHEPSVLTGAKKLISEGRISNLLMEYSPHGEPLKFKCVYSAASQKSPLVQSLYFVSQSLQCPRGSRINKKGLKPSKC